MRYLIPIVLLMLFACKKPEDRSCFKSTGEQGTKEILLDDFEKIFFGPHLKYVIIQDTVNKVILHGGKNLLNLVETSLNDEGRLILKNNNKCNFLRDYSKMVTVELHVKKIVNILYEGTQDVICDYPLQTDYLAVVISDGAGKLNLAVDAEELWLNVTNGWGNFGLSGSVKYLNLQIDGNGFGEAYGLSVLDSMDVISNTPELLKVFTGGSRFRVQTQSSGDVWYIGSPSSLTWDASGSGQLVDKN